MRQAAAERELARLNLSYTEVRAPVDGFIGNRSGRTGAYATAGAQILSLVPARGLWMDANFKESQIARISPSQRVQIFADVLPETSLPGMSKSWRRQLARSSVSCRQKTRPVTSPRSRSAFRFASGSMARGLSSGVYVQAFR
ncbi:HlyD family efflux transporter periplasmic adaptor subunit [Methylocapsa sp. D3K7]|uniref:HlyD family secretion protein n=1 Tax=Methylocapsa sp. D3K7 TaxID=3041435 RepID=UPI00244EE9CB|nr:HlyD family efflux transporter periplasmic adaptor subunit [Methylocapsa sp. D3K7]WGJ13230.1 HlyD family efflux transporter periplasmic adaptor subunit [Methylocapsa sp. D3K7]